MLGYDSVVPRDDGGVVVLVHVMLCGVWDVVCLHCRLYLGVALLSARFKSRPPVCSPIVYVFCPRVCVCVFLCLFVVVYVWLYVCVCVNFPFTIVRNQLAIRCAQENNYDSPICICVCPKNNCEHVAICKCGHFRCVCFVISKPSIDCAKVILF